MYTKSYTQNENLMKASKQIFCSHEKVLVLIWNSEFFCVHRQWIQYYFRFHKILCSPENLLLPIFLICITDHCTGPTVARILKSKKKI